MNLKFLVVDILKVCTVRISAIINSPAKTVENTLQIVSYNTVNYIPYDCYQLFFYFGDIGIAMFFDVTP